MRLTRVTIMLSAGLIAVAGTAAGTALAASSTAASGQVVLVQCNGAAQVRPHTSLQPGCMGSNQDLSGLRWTSWGSSAFGSGTFAVNNCSPSSSCGPSGFTKYSMLIVLWRPEARPGHAGQRYFSRMTAIFNGAKHPHGPSAQSWVLRA
jgi:hypothetical protein